ncbi:MAG: cytochrome c biogenesis protein CcsA [Cystobacterineae bacterium]|nr:cytochrome c biogenesis protein CcsA [Cystobacterineae bacterium]
MNSLLGYSSVVAALGFAAMAAMLAFASTATQNPRHLSWARLSLYAFAACMLLSNLIMVGALVANDFSVHYVSKVGSLQTPLHIRLVALWSALEGSILFWGGVLGAYVAAFAWKIRKGGPQWAWALGVMAAVSVFFAALIAWPANPWTPVSPPPLDGPGPNPLLQNHWLMVLHPPTLYVGYVGMVVPFGIAAGALLSGKLDDSWVKPLRQWTLFPWLFLTIGIVLGGWWAYAVLGWGGYWAWDPVENASLLPWLTATAYMHATLVLERKRSLKLWTLALALLSFILTILGTFMTRSGVFNSVHAFTQSNIGPVFLVFIALLCVFSVLLLALRSTRLASPAGNLGWFSREMSLLVGNLVLITLTFTVLLGTLFPLLTEAFQNKKISVGAPFFNQFAFPMGIALVFLMGLGPALPWGKLPAKGLLQHLLKPLGLPLLVGIGVVGGCLAAGLGEPWSLAMFGCAAFAAAATLRALLLPAWLRSRQHQENFFAALWRSAVFAPRRFGGFVTHMAFLMAMVAVAASSAYVEFTSATLRPGESLQVGTHAIRFEGFSQGRESNRSYMGANIAVLAPGAAPLPLHGPHSPRLNYYMRMSEPIASPAVDSGLWRDVYVSLVATNEKAQTATLNAWVFPLVGWLWYSLVLLCLGTLWALLPAKTPKTPSPRVQP